MPRPACNLTAAPPDRTTAVTGVKPELVAVRSDPWVLAAAGLVLVSIPFTLSAHLSPELTGRSSIWLEAALIGLNLAALVLRGRRSAGAESRSFWFLLAAACGLYLLGNLLLEPFGGGPVPAAVGLLADLSYALVYLALLLALEFRPHQGAGWLAHSRIPLIEMVGGFVAVLAMFVYFVVAPARLGTAGEWTAPFLLYILLDGLVLMSLLRNRRAARAEPWILIYSLLIAATGLLLGLNGLGLLADLGVAKALSAPFFGFETFWFLMHFCVLVASRVPVREGAAAEVGIDWGLDPESGRLRRSSLIVYALALPAIHLSLSVLGWVDEATRQLREMSLLGFLMVFGALALIHLQRLERERMEAREGCFRLFEVCPVMLVLAEGVDRPGRILNCNPLFAATLGREPQALFGEELASFLTPVPHPDGSAPEAEESWEAQLSLGEGAGLPVLVMVRRVAGAGRPVWLVTLADLRRQKVLEERLRQVQKLEAVGRLAGGVAHDFNNILMVVEGYASLLSERLAGVPELQDHAREIKSAARRAARLVQQLLAFGRRQMLRPTRTRLNAEVAKFAHALRRLLRPEIQLVMKLEAVSDEVSIDVGRIQEVLLNLVANAQEAIPGAGVVRIATRDVVPREAEDAGGGAFVALEVMDTGSGIPREFHEKIFEPFFTTKGSAQASGLGLSSVLGIVEQSGGRITVESAPGAGATFRILLPVSEVERGETGNRGQETGDRRQESGGGSQEFVRR